MSKKKRVLVTGGLGTVGSGIVKQLRSRGHHVISLGKRHSNDEIGFSLKSDLENPFYASMLLVFGANYYDHLLDD